MTPTAIGASSRSASAAIVLVVRRESSNVVTSIVFSGHSTRSMSASSGIDRGRLEMAFGDERRRAPRARSCPVRRRPARRRCSTSRRSGCPVGATNERHHDQHARRGTRSLPSGEPDAPGRMRRANAGTPGAGPASANPSWKMSHVMRITPPMRATPRNGPPTCEMPSEASGTPPNGNEKRSASASVWAAGRPITRHGPLGRDERGDGVVQRVDRAGDEVAGQRELDHPPHAEVHPAGAEQVAEQEPLAARRLGAERDLEQHHADDGERPEPPRWHRQRDERAGAERQRRARHTAISRGAATSSRGIGVVVVGDMAATRNGVGSWRSHRNGGAGRAPRQTSASCTTMRCRVEPGGWQANSVAVGVSDGSMIHSASGPTISVPVDGVVEHAVGGGERDDVARHEIVDVAEIGVVARAMAGDHDVADLPGHRRARPVPRPAVERGQPDALVQRRVEADASGSRSVPSSTDGPPAPLGSGGGAIGWSPAAAASRSSSSWSSRSWWSTAVRGRRARRRASSGAVVVDGAIVVGRRRRSVVTVAAATAAARRRRRA